MKKGSRRRYAFLAVAAILALVLLMALRGGSSAKTITLSQFQTDISGRSIVTAVIHDGSGDITGKLTNGQSYKVNYPSDLTQELSDRLVGSGAKVSVSHNGSDIWGVIFETYGPILLLGSLFVYAIFAMQGGGSRVVQFGKAKARTANKEQPKVTFADVAGADEAVAELQEIKEFLESPARFQALGAKIPKGVLLFGPPGTGKTLLARAVAGEAGVPFFSISGSDFVEMFVGVGASRVRDLFEQAKNNAPSIVFMDEIDAVGRHRGAGLGGGHDEREQTLNQLLVEMDGFDMRGGVILIAATNRPDILDPALLRPGRFDRQIVVDRPDLAGRRRILGVHARGKPLARSADLDVLAKRTPGFTGADLANLLNEAAILTARRNLRQIGMRECEEAIDRVLAGPERKTLVMNEHDKLVTAYHEAGHAIVGHVLVHADPIHKVSIVARSRSLGLTYTLPEDRFNHSRSQLRDTMAMCLGGRTAEEIVFEEPTTGAENDIEKVTRIARSMVTEYGMSDVLGPQQFGRPEGEVFLGRDINHQSNYSEEVAGVIDGEIRRLIDEAHSRARAVLVRYRATLDQLARELVEKETVDSLDLAAILGPVSPVPGARSRAGSRSQPVVAAARPVQPVPPVPPSGRPVQPVPPVPPSGRPGRAKVAPTGPPGTGPSGGRAPRPVVSAASRKRERPAVGAASRERERPAVGAASRERERPATVVGRASRERERPATVVGTPSRERERPAVGAASRERPPAASGGRSGRTASPASRSATKAATTTSARGSRTQPAPAPASTPRRRSGAAADPARPAARKAAARAAGAGRPATAKASDL